LTRGYRELEGLELDSGVGNCKFDVDSEGQILKTATVEVNELGGGGIYGKRPTYTSSAFVLLTFLKHLSKLFVSSQ